MNTAEQDRWDMIQKGWRILEERNEALVEEYMKAIKEREKREREDEVKRMRSKGGRWEGRTLYDSEGRPTGKIGFSRRKLNLKPGG